MTEIVWIYGSSGVGKTKYIVDEVKKYNENAISNDENAISNNENAISNNENAISIVDHVRGNYIEGFISKQVTKVVILDNYSEEMMTIDNLINLFDGGVYNVKRQGMVEFKPEIVYISCLYEPDRCLQVYNSKRKLTSHQQQKIEELKARITTFVHLTA